jgi:hypothetical protein
MSVMISSAERHPSFQLNLHVLRRYRLTYQGSSARVYLRSPWEVIGDTITVGLDSIQLMQLRKER